MELPRCTRSKALRTPLAKIVSGALAANGLYVPGDSVRTSSGVVVLGYTAEDARLSRSSAAFSRCSGRLPQAASGAPAELFEPCVKYRKLPLKSREFVSWSLAERGSCLMTWWALERFEPSSAQISPPQSTAGCTPSYGAF